MPRAKPPLPVPSKGSKPALWFVYLLECEDGSLYAGVALDVLARFVQHALGLGAAYTRAHPPFRILACRSYPGQGEALRAEYALKQLPRAHKLEFFSRVDRVPGASTPTVKRVSVSRLQGLPRRRPDQPPGVHAPAADPCREAAR